MSAAPVTVRIYGESYPLKTGEDPEYVAEIARFVDARMREVAGSGKVMATSKIAVLAALHIADELYRLRRELDPAETERRIVRLTEELERALDAAAPEG